MYLNTEYIISKGYSCEDIINLILIKQRDSVQLMRVDEGVMQSYICNGLCEMTKGSGERNDRIRITKKGKEFLIQCTTYGYSDDTGRLVTTLQELYRDSGVEEHRLGKTQDVLNRLLWFLSSTPFDLTDIYYGVKEYVNTIDDFQYILSLDNLFWKKPSGAILAVNMNLKDSYLFQFMCQWHNLSPNVFIDPTSKAKKYIEWVNSVAKCVIPKDLPPEMYFTGSYPTEVKAKKRIKLEIEKEFRK